MPRVSTEARLPPELERHIFEISALSRPVAIPNLSLVAWRVKTWVEPLLYHVLFMDSFTSRPIDGLPSITGELLLRLVNERPKPFFAHSVRYLVLEYKAWGQQLCNHRSFMPSIFLACTGVTHLWLKTELRLSSEELSALTDLRDLRCLAIRVKHLFKGVDVSQSADFVHPVLRNVTHLEVLDLSGTFNDYVCTQIARIPNLTHLSFRVEAFCAVLVPVLRASSQLQCLVFLCPLDMETDPVDDPRFVIVRFLSHNILVDTRVHWQQEGLTGESYWAKTDRFLAGKRAGEIDEFQYLIYAE
ncbi:hypothetical protein B0H19DRAFT_662446 [Mycena capillaripes]|nr:hypothetical protein B0H19DRAFT_662446 [Mycena capillaripes]